MTRITTYAEADALLTGRCRDRRKIDNNTYLERREDGSIAVRLHATDVVTYLPNGSVRLNTGGWLTVTTKDRINKFSPHQVRSEKGRWYVNGSIPFSDGMEIDANGVPFGVLSADAVAEEDAANAKVRKDIRNWMRSLTADEVLTAMDPANRGGDCLLCRFGEDRCLETHVEEHYLHGTLIERALLARQYGNPGFVWSMIQSDAERGHVSEMLTRDLAKFLRRRIITGVAVS